MVPATSDDGLIRFEFNVPVHVSLKYADGKVIEGRYGESLLFTTTDGRRFFLPMSAGEQLAALGVVPGEPITVTKVESKVGRKVTASYKVERDGVLAVPAAPRPMASATMPGPGAGHVRARVVGSCARSRQRSPLPLRHLQGCRGCPGGSPEVRASPRTACYVHR